MQETRYPDGRVTREFVAGDTTEELHGRLEAMHRQALAGHAERITQQAIGRNQPCPCGSGKKFKKCCLAKANKGPFRIDLDP